MNLLYSSGEDAMSSGAGETIEINWESEEVDGGVEIDWVGIDEDIGNVDSTVDFEVVEDSNVMTTEGEVVAVGKEALTLLGV